MQLDKFSISCDAVECGCSDNSSSIGNRGGGINGSQLFKGVEFFEGKFFL
jgi:hypothetical protein